MGAPLRTRAASARRARPEEQQGSPVAVLRCEGHACLISMSPHSNCEEVGVELYVVYVSRTHHGAGAGQALLDAALATNRLFFGSPKTIPELRHSIAAMASRQTARNSLTKPSPPSFPSVWSGKPEQAGNLVTQYRVRERPREEITEVDLVIAVGLALEVFGGPGARPASQAWTSRSTVGCDRLLRTERGWEDTDPELL
jgi:GNAT superfamily N-acetyltransferase